MALVNRRLQAHHVSGRTRRGMVMGVRADERSAVKRGQVSQPDRLRWVLGLLEAGPHFRFREDKDIFLRR